jgi:putative sigma-54 modulation protein
MNIQVSGQQLDVTPALKDYVQDKMQKLERHFDAINNIHVVLSVEKLRQKADATINVTGAQLVANAEHEDMYAAIDALTDKLDRQVKKHKDKLKSVHA